jgi:hypothetical protein
MQYEITACNDLTSQSYRRVDKIYHKAVILFTLNIKMVRLVKLRF